MPIIDRKRLIIEIVIVILIIIGLIFTVCPLNAPKKVASGQFSFANVTANKIRYYDQGKKNISQMDLSTKKVDKIIDFDKQVYGISWSPSSSAAIITSSNSDDTQDVYWVLTLASNQLSQLNSKMVAPTWSPNGDEIAYFIQDTVSTLNISKPDGSDEKQLLSLGEDYEFGDTYISWSPDSKDIAISLGGTDVSPTDTFIINVATKNKSTFTTEPTGSIGAWSKTNKILFEVYYETAQMYAWKIYDFNSRKTTDLNFDGNMYWYPDGIFLIGYDGRILYKFSSDSKKKKTLYRPKKKQTYDYVLPDFANNKIYLITGDTLLKLSI